MEIEKTIYLGGTTGRLHWDWTTPFKVHLKPYFVHDAEKMRMDVLSKREWTSLDEERLNKLKASSTYEVYVVSPENYGYMTIAEAVDAAHRRKDRCIFLVIKSLQGPSLNIEMSEKEKRSVTAVEDLMANIGARIFTQPQAIINFLLSEAT